jgi:hypothetical protein
MAMPYFTTTLVHATPTNAELKENTISMIPKLWFPDSLEECKIFLEGHRKTA